MKVSKIIFFSLLGCIAILIFAGAIDIRINGKKTGTPADWARINKSIPSFSSVRLESVKEISISEADSNYVQIVYPKDSLPPDFNYSVKKDTLILSDLNFLKRSFFLTIYTKTGINKFYLKNSRINLNNLGDSIHLKNLYFDLDNSHVDFNRFQMREIKQGYLVTSQAKKRSSVGMIVCKGKNKSYLEMNDFSVDSLNVSLLNSTANLYVDVKKIKGEILKKSKFQSHQAREIYLMKDDSSTVRIN